MKFNEGEIHAFQVLKKINLPDEGYFYTLRHKSGRRLMLPAHTYAHYGIEPGAEIICRIDKVNCSGKVYLEPKHPLYREGEVYFFDIINFEISTNNSNEAILTVSDCFANHVKVIIRNSKEFIVNEAINLVVDYVKKGIPCLSHPNLCLNPPDDFELIGKTLSFTVKEIGENTENEIVYKLTDEDGYFAEIKHRHYKSYGFNVGETLNCRVYGRSPLGALKVEPQNPFYKIGETYSFKILNGETENSDLMDESYILIVEDITGKKCGVQVNAELLPHIKQNTRIKCQVVGFRRGRPKLELQ